MTSDKSQATPETKEAGVVCLTTDLKLANPGHDVVSGVVMYSFICDRCSSRPSTRPESTSSVLAPKPETLKPKP